MLWLWHTPNPRPCDRIVYPTSTSRCTLTYTIPSLRPRLDLSRLYMDERRSGEILPKQTLKTGTHGFAMHAHCFLLSAEHLRAMSPLFVQRVVDCL